MEVAKMQQLQSQQSPQAHKAWHIARRALASLIDWAIVTLVYYIIGQNLVLAVLFALLYFLAFESLMAQTLGKKICGLKVVADQGDLSFSKVLVRNLLRPIDMIGYFPVSGIVGVISMLLTPQCKRLGDLAAKTHVVTLPGWWTKKA